VLVLGGWLGQQLGNWTNFQVLYKLSEIINPLGKKALEHINAH